MRRGSIIPLVYDHDGQYRKLVNSLIIQAVNGEFNLKLSHGNTLLHVAAQHGNCQAVKTLLAKNVDINVRNHSNDTPLLCATKQYGSLAVIELLIAMGAETNVRNFSGDTPISSAVDNNNNEVVNLFIDLAIANKINIKFPANKTLLHLAAQHAHNEAIKVLVANNANINVKQLPLESTPLHLAAEKDYCDTVKLLIKLRANVNAKDIKGETALHYIAKTDNSGVVIDTLLNKGADVNARNRSGLTPLMISDTYSTNTFRTLVYKALEGRINLQLFEGNLLYHFVARLGNTNAIKNLFNNNLFEEIKSALGDNSHHTADETGDVNTIRFGNITLTKAMLNKNPFINVKNALGRTPLHEAAEIGDINAIDLLISMNANINAAKIINHLEPHRWEVKGEAPLHCAARRGHGRVVAHLIKKGADVHMRNVFLQTPLHSLCCAHITDFNTAKIAVKALVDAGATLDSMDKKGDTPLHLAVKNRQVALVQALCELALYAASPTDSENNVALDSTTNQEELSTSRALKRINSVNQCSETALHLAATLHSHGKIVSMLIQHNAEIDVKTRTGWTPLLRAAASSCTLNSPLVPDAMTNGKVITKLLAANADPKVLMNQQQSCLDLCIDTAVMHNNNPSNIAALLYYNVIRLRSYTSIFNHKTQQQVKKAIKNCLEIRKCARILAQAKRSSEDSNPT